MKDSDPSTSRFGKVMIGLGFGLALILLTQFFNQRIEQQYNPNQVPEVNNLTSGALEVVLKRNRQNHYVTTGTINGHEVLFLLDTGATAVSIPEAIALTAGLKPGVAQRAHTANGTVTVYHTVIEKLAIGPLFLYDVPANINPSMKGDSILLGMSALKQLEFIQKGPTLTLRQQP